MLRLIEKVSRHHAVIIKATKDIETAARNALRLSLTRWKTFQEKPRETACIDVETEDEMVGKATSITPLSLSTELCTAIDEDVTDALVSINALDSDTTSAAINKTLIMFILEWQASVPVQLKKASIKVWSVERLSSLQQFLSKESNIVEAPTWRGTSTMSEEAFGYILLQSLVEKKVLIAPFHDAHHYSVVCYILYSVENTNPCFIGIAGARGH